MIMPNTKKTAKKPAAKTVKKAAPKKTTRKIANAGSVKSNVVLQYQDKDIHYEDLVKKFKEIWTGTYKKKIIEIENVDLYIKPEENKVYFVVNNDTHGDFDL